jgi:PAS domain S-box-containing protein
MAMIPQRKYKYQEHVELEPIDLLQQILVSSEDIIFIIRENRTIQFTNSPLRAPATTSRYARPSEGVTHKDIYRALREPTEIVFRSGKPLSVERCLGRPDHEIWLHTLLTPITAGSGGITSVLAIARDISELKRKEKLIAESRAQWLQVIDSMPHLVAVIDLHGRLKKANRALADFLGIDIQDLLGQICQQTLGTKCPSESCPIRGQRHVERGSADFRSNILGHPFLITVSPLTNGSGETTGCLLVALDLNRRPSAEEIRRNNAEQMKLLLELAEYMVTIQDQNGRYLSIRALPGNIRLPEAAIIGKTPFDFFETEQADKMCERIRKAIGAGEDLSVSRELKLAGETFHLHENVSPVRDEQGNVSSVMTIWKKITGVPEKRQAVPNDTQELTRREQEILKLISSGLTSPQIAEKLFISGKTVETHRSRIMRKVGVHKVSGLVSYAVRCGLS